MYNLPGAIFRPKDHRGAQVDGCNILTSSDFRLLVRKRHDIGKFRCYILRHRNGVDNFSVSETLCSEIKRLGNFVPSTNSREKWIGQGYIVAMRKHRLIGFRITLEKLGCGKLIFLKR